MRSLVVLRITKPRVPSKRGMEIIRSINPPYVFRSDRRERDETHISLLQDDGEPRSQVIAGLFCVLLLGEKLDQNVTKPTPLAFLLKYFEQIR